MVASCAVSLLSCLTIIDVLSRSPQYTHRRQLAENDQPAARQRIVTLRCKNGKNSCMPFRKNHRYWKEFGRRGPGPGLWAWALGLPWNVALEDPGNRNTPNLATVTQEWEHHSSLQLVPRLANGRQSDMVIKITLKRVNKSTVWR
jgi:hypothetical protein